MSVTVMTCVASHLMIRNQRSLQQLLTLPEGRSVEGKPSVYGDLAAYVSGDINLESAKSSGSGYPIIDANWALSVLNLKTGEVKDIVPVDNNMKLAPKICGDIVVWFDARNSKDTGNRYGNFDVYAYDLKNNSGARLSSTTSAVWDDLAISGDRVVWRDNRNGEADHLYDIYAYDLKSNHEKRLTSVSSSYDWEIGINGNNVVWVDGRHIGPESIGQDGGVHYDYTLNTDIYLYDWL